MRQVTAHWDRLIREIRKKGHERLTLMIIPHNESHIFNLQVSKFTIAFAFVAVIIVTISSIVSIKLKSNVVAKASDLYDANKQIQNEREQFLEKSRDLFDLQENLRSYLIQAFEESGFDSDEEYLFNDSGDVRQVASITLDREAESFAKSVEQYRKDIQIPADDTFARSLIGRIDPDVVDAEFRFHPDVETYRRLHYELKQFSHVLTVYRRFLEEREFAHANLPFYWPVAGGHFTSFFGWRISPFGYSRDLHTGVDLADAVGTIIYASGDGQVVFAGYNSGYGNSVKISHAFGFVTLYAHMSSLAVYQGQYVRKGQIIGRMGATGRVTGPHLHYEVRLYDTPIDPLPYLTNL